MKQSQFIPPEKRVRRRWRVPPALIYGSEPLEGGSVLQELRGETGLLLWQALRDVTLWACTPPVERTGLFSPEAERRRVAEILSVGPQAPLEEALGVITGMVGRPERTRAEQVALACRRIAQWAEAQGHLATALAFFQGAALACPGDAASAFKVGQIARKRAENARAESWFRRTIALARQAGDWSSYALAFLGLGTLYMQKGNFPIARKFYVRCLRAARRHCLKDTLGCANHDLMAISILSGSTEGVERYARAAFDAYGRGNQRLPRLAHDVAYFWITQGHFSRAIPVLRALVPHTRSASEQLILFSNLARAAGATGNRDLFDQGWDRALEIIDQGTVVDQSAEAWLELAHGAVSLKQWARASRAAGRALELATNRGEARIRLSAESVLDSMRLGQPQQPETTIAETGYDLEAEVLASDFVASLSGYVEERQLSSADGPVTVHTGMYPPAPW